MIRRFIQLLIPQISYLPKSPTPPPSPYLFSPSLQAFTPLCYGNPCAGAVAARGAGAANGGRSTMAVSPFLSVTPAFRAGNLEGRPSRRWGASDRSGVVGRGRVAGQGALEGVGGEGGRAEEGRGEGGGEKKMSKGGLRGGFRPAALLHLLRQSVERRSGRSG